MTMTAETKLSNWAARTRNTTASAMPKVTKRPEEVSPSVAASASGTRRMSSVRTSPAIPCNSSNASPSAKSGRRLALIGTERRCDSRPSSGATGRSVSVANEDTGTICPSRAFTKIRSRSPGSLTGSEVETSRMS